MPKTHAFDFLLENPSGVAIDFAVAALYGGDSALTGWSTQLLAGEADLMMVDGPTARWADLSDELCTASLFDMGEKRTIVVREADKFVSSHRPEIEKYLAKPGDSARLVLQLESLASNTKVYKLIDASHRLIGCGSEMSHKTGATTAKRRKFLSQYIAKRHQTKLATSAADALTEMLGDDLGLLDTEIAKLSLYLAPGETIEESLVREVVAGWQGKTIWQITEAISAGNAAEALRQLDKLIAGGQPAIALLPQIAWSLRRLGLATSVHLHAERSGRRQTLEDSLAQSGINRPHEVSRAVSDMKRMGRDKAAKLLPWLLDADLRLKGTHSSEGRDRLLLEQFVMRMAGN